MTDPPSFFQENLADNNSARGRTVWQVAWPTFTAP